MGPGLCDNCHAKPKHVEGTHVHQYCGKKCAASAQAHKHQAGGHGGHGGHNGHNNTHHVNSATICLMCRKAPKHGPSHFCSNKCAAQAESKAICLLEVPQGHDTFKSVEHQFKDTWRMPGRTPPSVKYVYKIVEPASRTAKYNHYRATVEARGQFTKHKLTAGNECRRWHGTRRECQLGEPGNTTFCASTTCALCSIIKSSFNLAMSRGGRFGNGIYTSSTSSKSDGYASNAHASPVKAILLNKVVVGKCHKNPGLSPTLNAAPAGYDSVVAPGSQVAADELIVYDNDAVRPSFLVVYQP